jgi:hypothetical protein
MRWRATSSALIGVAALLAGMTASCTSAPEASTGPPSTAAQPDREVVELRAGSYRIECNPVPQQMLDVKIANAASPSGEVWAIASVPSSQAVAIPARDRCGPFALAVSERLSPETAAALVNEVRALEDRFGGVALPA